MTTVAAADDRWFVYLLECRDGSLYTGIAVDVEKRLAAHRAGTGARYTRAHPPQRIVGVRACADRGEALRLEYAVKRLRPAMKRAFFDTAAAAATPVPRAG
ncbi:GIY-YIG nuclease family protein [Coralloluteibacterium stylophorae]|uniref:GIY-YIG nuclease family protein n=1 Tax=Coralloluteibacterium stylophorae TaxID=1776034 RepID=A0A8J7VY46_9GAMM|nr:GIY-YIG nuclease family protein [Coralloluteibacterium stylophorae]MBS7456516.1 GIY-YIG nuclease family protein [Coralloluteibacterium stylophorae]